MPLTPTAARTDLALSPLERAWMRLLARAYALEEAAAAEITGALRRFQLAAPADARHSQVLGLI